jgi:hypothetical protein
MTDLAALLEEQAAAMGASADRVLDGVAFRRGDLVFAALERGTAHFRLDPAVAAAAERTPDATPSPRGPDWVAFAPPDLDGHAADRAAAWFDSAWRRAGG